jgi:hypothetical protein
MIVFQCSCGKRYHTQSVNVGKRVKCPECGTVLIVPTTGGVAKPATPSSEKGDPPPWWDPKAAVDAATTSGLQKPGDRTQSGIVPRNGPVDPPKVGAGERLGVRGRLLATWPALVGVTVLSLGIVVWAISPGDKPVPASQGPQPSPAVGESPTNPIVRVTQSNPPTKSAPGAAIPENGQNQKGGGLTTGERQRKEEPEHSSGPAVASNDGLPKLRILVPAYFYPSGQGLKDWHRLIDAAARAPILAVANPASGPGEAANPEYIEVISHAARRGVTVLGYVNTEYANRPPSEVRADVDLWVKNYSDVRGIFFDAQASQAANAEYYSSLRDYVRKKIPRAVVITNPGTLCAEEYLARSISDVTCVYEFSTGFDRFRLPTWAFKYPSGRFAAMPYKVANAELMKDYIQLAVRKELGVIYISDTGMPNPWERLPSYWDEEVEEVSRANRQRSP